MTRDHSVDPSVLVLGSAQDGGVPQAGCRCSTCAAVRAGHLAPRLPASLGLIDRAAGVSFLIDATPAFAAQWDTLLAAAPDCTPAGILLTHAHLGHYTGLLQLGREVIDSRALPVFASERMAAFLSTNGPWRQLIEHGNIVLQPLEPGQARQLSTNLTVEPHAVPHRAEWSDTLSFMISGPQRRLWYCPDIDRWTDWQSDLRQVVDSVDVALIDGTFFNGDELPGRDMRLIPHPTVLDSLQRLQGCTTDVRFIHLNHSNPLLVDGPARAQLQAAGFAAAVEAQIIPL
jgi:pyrroloquinoline quinone biosynthesis protein B